VKKTKARELAGIFADHISNFIEIKKLLGYQFEKQPAILMQFDRYLCEINYRGSLT